MRKVIISGASSCLGIALINECIRNNVGVIALMNHNSERNNRIPKSSLVKKVFCSLDDMKRIADSSLIDEIDPSLKEVVNKKDADTFFHFAWQSSDRMIRNDPKGQIPNIEYVIDAICFAKAMGCSRFIGAGSQAEYGRSDSILGPGSKCNPETAYGAAKLCAKNVACIFCKQMGMDFIWTRTFSAYGTMDSEGSFVSSAIITLLNKEHFECTACEQKWDYIFEEDAGRAFFLIGEKGVAGKTYCIGSGKSKKLKYFIEIIKDKIDKRATIGYGEIPYGQGQIMCLRCDISELTKDTGFVPQVSFGDGTEKTINYWKNKLKNRNEEQ